MLKALFSYIGKLQAAIVDITDIKRFRTIPVEAIKKHLQTKYTIYVICCNNTVLGERIVVTGFF